MKIQLIKHHAYRECDVAIRLTGFVIKKQNVSLFMQNDEKYYHRLNCLLMH